MSKRVIVYARQSTEDQSDYSLPVQLKECRKYAEQRGHEVVGEFSEYFTGTSLNRPELNKVRDLAGEIDVLIVYNVDRLSRDPVDLLSFHRYLAERGTAIDYAKEDFDPSTDIGQFMLFLQGMHAKNYRKTMMEQLTRGKIGRAESGRVLIGHVAPYGYDYDRESGTLVLNEAEAEIVKMIYQWYVFGDENGKKYGRRALALKLTEMGIPTKRDKDRNMPRAKKKDGVWNKSTVDRILTSEVYTGVWYYNRRDTRINKYRPREEWVPVEVPAIVDEAMFQAVQKQAKKNTSHPRNRPKRNYLMQGRLDCAKCGMKFYGQPGSGGYAYYLCGGQRIENSVDNKTKVCHRVVSVKQWDALIWDAI